MISVTKDFIAKIALGIEGTAIIEITETLSQHSTYVGSGIADDLIIQDIRNNYGDVEEWAEHALQDVPEAPGVYTFRGSVKFDEDSADYSTTCDDV